MTYGNLKYEQTLEKGLVVKTFAEYLIEDKKNDNSSFEDYCAEKKKELCLSFIYRSSVFITEIVSQYLKDQKEKSEDSLDDKNDFIDYFMKKMIVVNWTESSYFSTNRALINNIIKSEEDEKWLLSEDFLEKTLESYHDEFLKLSLILINYHYKQKDTYHNFLGYNIPRHSSWRIISKFKKEVYEKLYYIEDFKAYFKPIIESKLDIILNKKYVVPPAVLNGKLYKVSNDISLENIIKTKDFPRTGHLNYIKVKINGINSFEYVFSNYNKEDYDNYNQTPELTLSPMRLNVKGVHAERFVRYQTEEDYKDYFWKKEDAENFHKKELRQVRDKINNILSEKYVF